MGIKQFWAIHKLLRKAQARYRRSKGLEPTTIPILEGGEIDMKFLQALSGKKTHIIGWASGLIGLLAITGWVPGLEAIDNKAAVEMILGGFGLSALRAGVTKSGPTS